MTTMTQHDMENDPMSSPPARRFRSVSAMEAVSPESSPIQSAPRPLSSRIGGSASRSSRPGGPGRAKSGDSLNSMQRGTMTPRRNQRTVPRTPMTARSKARVGSLAALDLAKNIYSLDMSSDNVSVASSIASTAVQPPPVFKEKEGSHRESRSKDKDRTRDRSRSQSRGRRQGGRNRRVSSSKDSPPSSPVDMGEERTLPLKDHDGDRDRSSGRRDRDRDKESSSSRLGASVSSTNSPGNNGRTRSNSLNARAAVRASSNQRDKNSKNWKSPLPEKLGVAVSEDDIRNFLAASKPLRQQGELHQSSSSGKDREQRSDHSPVRSTHTISSIPVRRGEREKSESSLENANANSSTSVGSRPPRASRGIGRSRSGEGLPPNPPKSSDSALHQSCHLDYMGSAKTRPAPRVGSRGVARTTSASSAERSGDDRDIVVALNESTRSEMPRQSRPPRRYRGSGSQGGDDADLNASTRSEMVLRPPVSSSSSSSSKPRDSSRLRNTPLKTKSNDDVIFEMRRAAAGDAAKAATANGGGNRDEKAKDLNVFLGQVSRRTKKSSNSGSRSVSSMPMRPRHRAATPSAIAQRIRNNSRRNIFVDGNESAVSSEHATDEEPSEEEADGVDFADYASFRVQLDEVAHVNDDISGIYDDDDDGTIGYEDLKPDSNNSSDPHGGLGRSIQDLMVGDERELQLHMHRTDDLLFSVFPKHVAEALRQGKKVEPEHHDMVTIFFSDIVGFTDISATLNPMKISELLDRLYNAFDALSHYHDVFKVETIGDAYMCAANLIKPQPDHSKRIAEFAIAAIRVANQTQIDIDDPSKGNVNIRVGFHSGPVVSNVVGSRNPRYCLFGDTVNTASRMESNSQVNRIHCSEDSAKLLQVFHPEVKLNSRGVITVKGKGKMTTYWVNEDEKVAEEKFKGFKKSRLYKFVTKLNPQQQQQAKAAAVARPAAAPAPAPAPEQNEGSGPWSRPLRRGSL